MTESDEYFSGNYVELVVQELSFYDLFKMLIWRSEIEKMGFVHSHYDKKYLQNRRIVLFLSLFSQKIVLLFSKLHIKLGLIVEFCLNLVYSNGGFLMLFIKFFSQEELEIPNRESEKFMSIIGHLDTRVELDKRIKPGDDRYFSSLTVMASKISYENRAFVKTTVQDCWKMKLVEFYDFWNDFQDKRTTQAFILQDKTSDPNIILVVFRGTEVFDPDAWITDLDLSWYRFPEMGKIHSGFIKSLGLQKKTGWPKDIEPNPNRPMAYYSIREKLRELLRVNPRSKFIITGHSLGGALAVLFPAVLALHEETWLLNRLHGIYTYGQPRVGNKKFIQFMESVLQRHRCKYFRFVYSHDIVTRLPSDDPNFKFKHFGTCLYFNSCYQGKEVMEEPFKNYISFYGSIQRYFIALWELARSFLVPYMKGSKYKETWLLKIARVWGFVFTPGLIAHNLHDYVNLTRLGSHRLFSNLRDTDLIFDTYYSSSDESVVL